MRRLALASLLLAAGPANGTSLWRAEGDLFGAWAGWRAGDLVTIVVEERSNAAHDWKHEREKEWEVDARFEATNPPAAFAGNNNPLNKLFPFLRGSLDYKSDYEVDNKTDRSVAVSARLTAQVVEVLPNGNLRLEAKKRIQVNNEAQDLVVRGVVRPVDIRSDNTVPSTALAEAEVELTGSLAFRNASRNPISAFFSWLGNILF